MRIPLVALSLCCGWLVVRPSALGQDWQKEKLGPHEVLVNNRRVSYLDCLRTMKTAGSASNGVYFELEAVVGDDAFRLTWTMWYTGKRKPLITVRPSLPGDQTTLVITSGSAREMVTIKSSSGRGDVSTSKEGFLHLATAKKAVGHLDLPKKDLLRLIENYMFVDSSPAQLTLQLVHRPSDRGAELDAWTGEVKTNVVHVKFRKK
jgi:hypothetical protein